MALSAVAGPSRACGARRLRGARPARRARPALLPPRAEGREGGAADGAQTSTAPAEADGDGEGAAQTKQLKNDGMGAVNLYDPVATASRLVTRRFGFNGALAFIAVLASVEGFELVKAALERGKEGSGEPVETGSGLVYVDQVVGGGVAPAKGDFVGFDLEVYDYTGNLVFDTKQRRRPVAFVLGSRPMQGVQCAGLEEGVSGMRRQGRRELRIPPALAFPNGAVLPNGAVIKPDSPVVMVVEIKEISPSYFG